MSTPMPVPTSVAELRAYGLSVRAVNSLRREGIYTVDQLVQQTRDDLMDIRSVGVTIVDEIRTVLARIGKELAPDRPVPNQDVLLSADSMTLFRNPWGTLVLDVRTPHRDFMQPDSPEGRAALLKTLDSLIQGLTTVRTVLIERVAP